jgi:hypothetical protein
VLAAALGLVVGAGPVAATHQLAGAYIWVWHGSSLVDYHYTYVTCTTTSCSATVNAGRRDAGRAARWCDDTTVNVVVPTGETTASVFCYGPSTWKVEVYAVLIDSDYFAVAHSSDVTVAITVSP